MNAIMGSGMLGLPFVMSKIGIVMFAVLISTMAIQVERSIHLLIVSAQVAGVRSYEELGEAAFGQKGKALVCTMICMQNIGAMTSYLVVIGDIGPSVVRLAGSGIDPIFQDRGSFLVIITTAIIFPLACLREIG